MDSDAVSTSRHVDSPSRCPSLGLLGTDFVPERLPVSERVCLAKPRSPWSPGTDTQASLCLTPEFGRCSCLTKAVSRAVIVERVQERGESTQPADDNLLKWFAVAAMGCLVGVIASAVMFLFLATPVHETSSDPDLLASSLAADQGTFAGEADATTEPDPDEAGRHLNGTDFQQILSRTSAVLAASKPATVERVQEPALAAELSRGAPPDASEQTHLVSEGETLWEIAINNGLAPGELAARNGLAPDDLIVAGDTLVIPSAAASNQP